MGTIYTHMQPYIFIQAKQVFAYANEYIKVKVCTQDNRFQYNRHQPKQI